MAVHMRNGIQYGGIPNGTVKGVNPSTVPTTVKQLNQIGTVGNIAPVTIPSAVKFSNGNTLETAIGSVATIETSPAVAAHDAGEYIFYNGQMYKVIAAIAVGETLTVDTNIEATSVGTELTQLNNGLASVNIASVTRIATTVTTGTTGNVILPYANDGKKYVVAPFALQNAFLRAWVAQSNNQWYLTAVNPNTGATINNTSLDIRYLLITLKSI